MFNFRLSLTRFFTPITGISHIVMAAITYLVPLTKNPASTLRNQRTIQDFHSQMMDGGVSNTQAVKQAFAMTTMTVI